METEIYNLIYKLDKYEKNLKILGEDFLKNNKNKGCFIIFNKKYYLRQIMPIKNIRNLEFDKKFILNEKIIDESFWKNDDEFKIKLILNRNIYNKSYMFKDCETLLQVSYKDSKFNEIIDDENYLNELINKGNKLDKENENNNTYFDSPIYYNNFYEKREELNLSSIMEGSNFNKENSEILYFDKNLSLYKNNNSNIRGMFKNCSLLTSLSFITNWNYANFTDLSELFSGCAK